MNILGISLYIFWLLLVILKFSSLPHNRRFSYQQAFFGTLYWYKNFRNFRIVRNCKREYKNYKSYLPNLASDFNHRCAYCNTHDRYISQGYPIDHFIPRETYEKAGLMELEYDYNNLMYCCPKCNNSKSSQYEGNINDGSYQNDFFYLANLHIDFFSVFKTQKNAHILYFFMLIFYKSFSKHFPDIRYNHKSFFIKFCHNFP